MKHWDEDRSEFDDVVRRLRDNKPEANALELDRMKLRAKSNSTSSKMKGSTLRTRLMVALGTLALMAGGTGGVIAKNGNGKGKGSASKSQYPKPGKGCGKPGQHSGPPGKIKKGETPKPCPTPPGKNK